MLGARVWVCKREDGREGAEGSGNGGGGGAEMVEKMPEDDFQSISEVTV